MGSMIVCTIGVRGCMHMCKEQSLSSSTMDLLLGLLLAQPRLLFSFFHSNHSKDSGVHSRNMPEESKYSHSYRGGHSYKCSHSYRGGHSCCKYQGSASGSASA